MRPLRFSINVTLDGCCDHREGTADEELHRHAVENLARADALLFGRVTYEMMEGAWRPSVRTEAMPDWTEPFAGTMDAAKKYVAGVKLALALTELGLIDEYEFVVHPRLAGHGPTLFAGLSKHVDLKLVGRLELGSGAVAMRYEPRR
jgi:dihydrofolate reductase